MKSTEIFERLAKGHSPFDVARDAMRASLDADTFDRSIGNCHHAGIDSIAIADDEQGMVRFFFARHDTHELDNLYNPAGHYTVGVHNHRYHLAIIPMTGTIYNHREYISDEISKGDRPLHEYEFSSAIADDELGPVGVRYLGAKARKDTQQSILAPGQGVVMADSELHTIVVPKDDSAGTAWMVVEGPQSNPDTRIYSPLTGLRITSDDLYQTMDKNRARQITAGVLKRMEQG